MKKLLALFTLLVCLTSCTDMVIASSTPSTVVTVGTTVTCGYPAYAPRYPVYALPPKEYWYRPSWRAPKPPKHEPWPPKLNPGPKPSPGFGNQVRRPVMRGPRTFNRGRR